MRRIRLSLAGALLLSLCISAPTWSRGVSPYLPLNLSPEIERQIERVLILGDQPVMTRPIAAATVWDALPKACKVDEPLCKRVERYLRRYMQDAGVTQARAEVAIDSGDSKRVIPNAHGMKVDSPWDLSAKAFYQPSDYLLLNVGGVAYQGRATPTGTMVSAGFEYAQLDVGYRDHWLSPLTDSSMLISTEAPTMPSVTLSNYKPISRLGINYQIFLAEMSKQNDIAFNGSTTAGHPRLAGLQVGIEPVSGYALSINRLFQYGGGARGGSGFSDFANAIFKNSNRPDVQGQQEEFGNQVASITSSIIFPGTVPFAVHVEYAGEDNSYKGAYRLGATDLSIGIDFPKLWERYDLRYEISEWQQAWYVHHLYPQGLTNHGIVIGHWFGDERQFGTTDFGHSQSLALGVQLSSGDYLQARYRMLANAGYSPIPYQHLNELSLGYTTTRHEHRWGAELSAGKDVFGDTYTRLALTMDMVADPTWRSSAAVIDDDDHVTDRFVDFGANLSRAYNRIAHNIPYVWTGNQVGYHVGLGARRKVSEHNDLGVRLELDDVTNHSLISIRALDYRYRFTNHLAMGGFFGFSRYEISLPAYGYYWGAGLQWMNLLKRWDVGFDWRYNDKLTRTKVLSSDASQDDAGGIYVDTTGAALYLSYRF